MQLLAIADDLTGALEAGAQLAEEGIACVVSTAGAPHDTPAFVVNGATRHAGNSAVAKKIRDIIAVCSQHGPIRHVYLKTDSTLRGPIAHSISALLSEYPDRKVVYAPAYPALGRVLRDGTLLVDGLPIAESDFSRDLMNPVRESMPLRLLSPVLPADWVRGVSPDGVQEAIESSGCRVAIVDGETDRDLCMTAAQACAARVAFIAAGTAAFVRAWARALDVPRSGRRQRPIARSGLIIVGSRHERSRAQVNRAGQRGIPAFAPDDNIGRVVGAVREHGWAIMVTNECACADPFIVASSCGSAVRDAAARVRLEALVLFGGDTASAVLDALGRGVAFPVGELLPGVAVSTLSGSPPVLVTKAGGFGDDDVIERIITRLEGGR